MKWINCFNARTNPQIDQGREADQKCVQRFLTEEKDLILIKEIS